MQSPPRRERDEDANLWDITMDEASKSQTPVSRRLLFARILKTCAVSNQLPLWDKYKDDLSEDYKDQQQQRFPEGKIEFSEEIYNSALIVIEDHVIDMGGEKLFEYGLPKTHRKKELSAEQEEVYMEIIEQVNNNEGGLFFLDGPAGTGKTYVIKLLLDEVRQRGEIAVAVASTGIAATLLPGGRTVHDAFKLPLNLRTIPEPVNKINENSSMAKVLRKCSLIVWDEATMSHKMALKCVNKTLKDLRNPNRVMGGVTVVLSGDFRQTLPVIPGELMKLDSTHL